MRKSTLILATSLVAVTGFALAYGGGDSSNQTTQVALLEPESSTNAMGQLPQNHPVIDDKKNFHGFAPTTTAQEKEPPVLAWKVPAAWAPVPNPNAMRLATYKLPHAAADKDDAELVVSRAGGAVSANISRWAGQFEGASTPKQTTKTIHDLPVTLVDIEGTYEGGMGGPSSTHEHWALHGAIVETKGQSYFFKIIGPTATVHAARSSFDAMIDAVTPN